MKWLLRKLFKKVRLIDMTEEQEVQILRELNRIEKFKDYLELQKQAGYQLYGQTKDERWLGYVDFARSLEVKLSELQPKPEPQTEGNGYESTV